MSHYRLLALDIDGTLVNSEHELTEPTRRAVLRAKEAGMEVVLATGRRYSRTLPLVEPLGLHVPVITASGALVKDPLDHRTLFRAQFGPGVLEQIVSIVARGGYDPVLYADTFDQGFDFYLSRLEVAGDEFAEFLQLNAGLRPNLARANRRSAAGNLLRLCHGATRPHAGPGAANCSRPSREQLYGPRAALAGL